MAFHIILTLTLSMLASPFVYARDPSPLQDFCVATNNATLFVNGKFCKNPKDVNQEDFFFSGFNISSNTNNPAGFNSKIANVDSLPGLNTLGVSIARLDYAVNGTNSPHIHPRGTEVLVVLQGTLFAGFVSSDNDNNRLFGKVLNTGDIFVFPQGLIHFQFNAGKTNAVALSAFGSQKPGVITVANAVFGSTPPISVDVLTKAFRINTVVANLIQAQFQGGVH